jgi:hypothetical protein
LPNLNDSGPASANVSNPPGGKTCSNPLYIFGLEVLLGSKQQYAEILPVDAEFPADLVAVALVKENRLQQVAIPGRHIHQDLPHLGPKLLSRNVPQGVDSRGRRFRLALVVERFAAGRRPVMLKKDVVAYRVHKGTQPVWLPKHAPLP